MAGQANRIGLLLLGAAFFSASAPAAADVEAGVNAWTSGDYAAAVREWATPAAQGDPDAQFNMAQAYRLGRGVEADPRQAEALYAKAAAQGHIKAADNYGLLLFQNGERERAIPYIEGAASRGDPRAQYILGIAHFNGDLAAKDWPRAYALLTLANGAGLPQARAALTQMDEYIPLSERQSAQTLAAALKAEAEASRARDLAAVDLALAGDAPAGPVVTATAPPPVAPRVAGTASAGADYTLPAANDGEVLAREVVVASAIPAHKPAPATTVAAARVSAHGGPWKVQLGAFGVAGNADRLWDKLSTRRELAGRAKLKTPAGRLTKLLAGGYATRAEADAACASLKASGQACLVTR
ncbi:SPOR domain-containing protein [Qipengyuania marisflavi]|uniref:Sporulation protein n=1 Tax=Qipengyuania marisflavi TaxID=2486356 RepID=A0A5S3PY38_9SPHN|nr:SPOR domain-containing protein [Qipengyuania marisflavi]TMM48686.1 sporulation protein [Qipengyuania marisflavi]